LAKKTFSWAEKWKRLDKILSCSFCPPHGGENLKRTPPKHGKTKPRYKDKRRIKEEW